MKRLSCFSLAGSPSLTPARGERKQNRRQNSSHRQNQLGPFYRSFSTMLHGNAFLPDDFEEGRTFVCGESPGGHRPGLDACVDADGQTIDTRPQPV